MHQKTLRLHMPQWQGGNVEAYQISSQVLSWLLPKTLGPEETVPVECPAGPLPMVDGMLAKPALLAQARAARGAIEKHDPDRILTIGGDCLVDLAPIAWLNQRHGGTLGVLWIDAHPDVQTRAETDQGNAQVLGMLLGRGDADFVDEVAVPLDPARVLCIGLDQWSAAENAVLQGLSLSRLGSAEATDDAVREWIVSRGISRLAVHLDVDALLPGSFRPMLFNKPGAGPDFLAGVPRGGLTLERVINLLRAAGATAEIVGLALTEYISWDAVQTRDLLRHLPLLDG
jgi:arginase